MGQTSNTKRTEAMRHHPASEIFAMLDGVKFEEFAEEIKQQGLINPIVMHPDGSILDGRNRYKACIEKGIEPRFVTWDGSGGTEATFVWQVNSVRRHLTEGAKQIAGARYARHEARTAEERRKAHLIPDALHRFDHSSVSADTHEPSKRSRTKAAEVLGTSEASLARAIVVDKYGTPEEIKAVEAGELPVARAAKNIAKRRRTGIEVEPPLGGFSLVVPNGLTMGTWASDFFRRNEAGETVEAIAKDSGVGIQTVVMMLEIAAVASRNDIPPDEIALAKKAVAVMNEQKQTAAAYRLVEPTTERLWGPKTNRRGKRNVLEKSRRHRFETVFGTLAGICSSAGDLPIPHIEKEKTVQILKELKQAVANVNVLRNKLGGVWGL